LKVSSDVRALADTIATSVSIIPRPVMSEIFLTLFLIGIDPSLLRSTDMAIDSLFFQT